MLFDDLTTAQRYSYALGTLQYVPYRWGQSGAEGTDCSGSVCWALEQATGKKIRFTADELFKRFFTVINPEADTIRAAFWICNTDRTIMNKKYKKGECAHVCGICGRDVVLNCVEPRGYLRSLTTMNLTYGAMGYRLEVRGLNIKAFKEA